MTALVNRLRQAISRLQDAKDIVLLMASSDVGNELVAQLGESRVRTQTLWQYIDSLASTRLGKLRLISPDEQEVLLHQIWHQVEPTLSEKSKLSFGAGSGLVPALAATISELRLFGITSENLAAESFLSKERGTILQELSGRYEAVLQDKKLADPARLAQLALDQVLEQGIKQHLMVPARLFGPTTFLSVIEQISDEQKTVLHHQEEDELLESITDVARLRYLKQPLSAPPAQRDGSLQMYRALSPEYEVRAVLGKLLHAGIPFDQAEVLYTEEAVYPPLFRQIMAATGNDGDSALCFRGGVPVRWTRVGRAIQFWIAWLGSHYALSPLVECIAQGLLKLPTIFSQLDWLRLVRSLPNISTAEAWRKHFTQVRSEKKLKAKEQEALDWLADLVLSQSSGWEGAQTPVQQSRLALRWLNTFMATVDDNDQQASLLLRHHLEAREQLASQSPTGFLDRLSAWVQETSLPPQSARPGTLALTPLCQTTSLQRPHTFIVGLSEDWYPPMPQRLSLLTDRERKNISPELQEQSVRELMHRQEASIVELLGGVTGSLIITYPCADQLDDRERFPSQLFLRIFRLTAELPEGDLQECESWLPPPLGPETTWCRLNETENWLNHWPSQPFTDALFKHDFLWLCRGAYASKQRASYRFTEHDGHVIEAGSEFDTHRGSHVYSAHSLQRYARCPLQFYFQDVLHLRPPDETEPPAGHWLHPIQRGEILHAIFHQYHLQLLKEKRTPHLVKDRSLLKKMLSTEIQKLEAGLPPVAVHVREAETQELEETLIIFLGEEAQWAVKYQPRYFEVTLGAASEAIASELDSSEPIPVRLPSGRTILMQGRVDRIDVLSDGTGYFIWDYKTGKMREYLGTQAKRTGQLLQPLLYLEMVQHRLREKLGPDVKVAGAGYFFPGQRGGQGDRLQWPAHELRQDSKVVDTMIDLLQAGIFLATDQPDTCRHCNFADICDLPELNRQATNKLKQMQNSALQQLRHFRKAP